MWLDDIDMNDNDDENHFLSIVYRTMNYDMMMMENGLLGAGE
jgi:hypothetical protein